MKRIRLVAALLALSAVLVAAGCGGSGEEGVPEGAIAVVDGQEITKAELDSVMARAKKSYESQKREFPKVGTPDYKSLQQQVVAFLVQREEYEQKAEELGIEVTDADVQKKVDEYVKTYFKGNDKELEKQIKAQGLTREQFEEDVRAQVVSEKLFAKATGDVKITDAEIQKYYEENKESFQIQESRDVRHILVKTKAEADRLYDEIKAGADFAVLAKKHSQDPGSKADGGKLTISRGQTVAPFDRTAFLLPAGGLSRPVKTEFGYHLIRPISEVRPGRTRPLAEVKAQIKAQLQSDKQNTELEKWVGDLRKEFEGKTSYAEGYQPPVAPAADTTETQE